MPLLERLSRRERYLAGSALAMLGGLAMHQNRLRKQNTALSAENKRLQELAMQDPLTGLANRRAAEDYYQRLRATEARRSYNKQDSSEINEHSIILIDLDHFKKINDRFGHSGGDLVLKRVARDMCSRARDQDFVFRLGGEEFGIIAPNTTETQAGIFSEDLRNIIETSGGADDKITASFGVSSFDPGNFKSSLSELLNCSDLALYEAKQRGRNNTVLYSDYYSSLLSQ
jgi:diguanylate cyclase (GGDEF)-like protein